MNVHSFNRKIKFEETLHRIKIFFNQIESNKWDEMKTNEMN